MTTPTTPRSVADIQAELSALQNQLGGLPTTNVYQPGTTRTGYGGNATGIRNLPNQPIGSRVSSIYQGQATGLQSQITALQTELAASQEYNNPANTAIRGYQTAYDEAKAANETRYNDILGRIDATTDQQAADIRTGYGEANANAQQGLARTGLANTTIAPTLRTGYQREMHGALNRNADQMIQTRTGVMERRTDGYPDQNSLMSLLQTYGHSGGLTGMRW